jgi:hypothetical protein
MTQKIRRVRTSVSTISRMHPMAGRRVTERFVWSQVRQYRWWGYRPRRPAGKVPVKGGQGCIDSPFRAV